VKGGFFLGKKPLEYVLSVYTISENAIKPCPFKSEAQTGDSSNLFGPCAVLIFRKMVDVAQKSGGAMNQPLRIQSGSRIV
jgi:hypothetical protein